jgi:hypothetical protein
MQDEPSKAVFEGMASSFNRLAECNDEINLEHGVSPIQETKLVIAM